MRAVNTLLLNGHELGHTPQSRRETWSVATRPTSVNGLGADPSQANTLLEMLSASIEFWDDIPGISDEWRRLVISLDVRGLQVHDANHAAAALCHGATQVLTLNVPDFIRFEKFGLRPMSPQSI